MLIAKLIRLLSSCLIFVLLLAAIPWFVSVEAEARPQNGAQSLQPVAVESRGGRQMPAQGAAFAPVPVAQVEPVKSEARPASTAFNAAPVHVANAAVQEAIYDPEIAPARIGNMRTGKWIEVILSEQRLVAWEGDRMVMTTLVSTGTQDTPTVKGTFRIYRKVDVQRMTGRDYDLPNVPYVMYFKDGYAIHGAYWHDNFGQPMSHGCVNIPTGKAAWLYAWAPRGTPVVVH